MIGLRSRLKVIPFFLFLIYLIISSVSTAFSAEKIVTKVVVRVVSKDSKVVGSGVGGAFVRIKNLETGEVLAQGKQEGGTGETDRIMVQPHKRGEVLFGTPDAAFFQAEIPLDKPTQVEVVVEAPLAYPHALQKGSKTITLIPGKHVLGEGLIIELNGLIVNVLSPSPQESLKRGEGVLVRAEVRMLWGCPITPGGLWDSKKFELWGQWIDGNQISDKFNLNYAGKASLFEGKTTVPSGTGEIRLQVLAADQAGNFGQHILSFKK